MKNGAAATALCLAFGAAKDPGQILMHRSVIGAQPVNQGLDIELCRCTAHRMPAIDVDLFAGGQGVGENLPYAQPIADIPGLRWKVWIINEAQSEAGGIYLFDDDAAVQAFVDGPIIAEMKGDPTLSIKAFDVIVELTTITRGPVK